jgi:alginate O-acetyltransferase complex protein AlgI
LGYLYFLLDLFKKVVIADTFALFATNGFDKAETLNLIEAWATSLSYTFQLYFDFSGYTDMAIGAALLFNIRLPINFNSPYKATDIQDFWRRWHITLSRFLKDYIYIPAYDLNKSADSCACTLF